MSPNDPVKKFPRCYGKQEQRKSHIRGKFTAGASVSFIRSNKCAFTVCAEFRFSLTVVSQVSGALPGPNTRRNQ